MKQYGVKPHISIISRLSPSSVTARGVSGILPLPMQAMAFFAFLPDHAVRQIPPSIGGTAGGNAVGLVGWPVSQDAVGACCRDACDGRLTRGDNKWPEWWEAITHEVPPLPGHGE